MGEKIRIYNPLKNRFVNVNMYGGAAKKLYKLYIDDLGTPAENVLPEGLKYNSESGYFTRTKEKKLVDKAYTLLKKYTYKSHFNNDLAQTKIPSIVKNIIRQYIGQSIKVATFFDGELLYEGIIDIPMTYSSWWKKSEFFRSYIMIDSENNIFKKELNLLEPMADLGEADYGVLKSNKNQGVMIIDTLQKVEGEHYAQNFLDGVAHCFFTPIYKWAETCLADSKSKSAIKRYNSYIKKIENYLDIYKKGVPENHLQAICDKLQISIEIDLPSVIDKKVKLLSIESNKKPLKIFKFINTRIDHLELNDIKTLDNYVEVENTHEMEKIERKLKKNKEFYFYKYNKGSPTKLYTFDTIYKLEDKYSEIVNKFQQDNNLDNYKIDVLKNPALSQFCLDAVKTNGTIDFIKRLQTKNPNDFKHIDMTRAYTKSQDCTYYRGILGKITDFRKTDKIMGLGLYEIINIKIHNELFNKLQFIHSSNIYTSAELEYLKDNGVDYDIVCGCWGTKIDIDFGKGEEDNTNMYEKLGTEGPRIYCKWFGCLTICEKYNKFRFNTSSKDFAKLFDYSMDNDYYGNIYYSEDFYGDPYGVIEYKKRKVYHQAHIASFITSYQRISILEQLKKMDIKNIARICVDGIYFKGETELCKNFTYKDNKTFNNEAGKVYCQDIYDFNEESWRYYNLAQNRINNKYEYHTGPGGSGKTHNNLVDNGLVDILFVAPSWKLARRKQKDYGCDSTTFYHILTDDPEVWQKNNRYYSVIVIDEVSMLSNHNKNRIMDRFKNQKIIFCGDVGYQLNPVYTPWEIEHQLVGNFVPEYAEYSYIDTNNNNIKVIMSRGNENILLDNSDYLNKEILKIPNIEHSNMYRCKCSILKTNLLMLRELIAKKHIDIINEKELNKLINYKTVAKELINYKIEDYIITHTHKNKDEYSEKYKELQKYYVKQKTRDYCNGEIVFNEKPIGVQSEIRHGYTIHSLQGETAEAQLFIDIRGMNSLKMLYTAISRAQYWRQIIFIK